MRAILLSLTLLTLNLSVSATNYYFSSSGGDDSRSAAQAKNPATPWRSLKKLTAVFPSLLPGDSVLLKRGDTFYGSLVIGRSGTASAPVVIAAYGSGAKPVISGFTQLDGWTSKGKGVYESSTALPNDVLNLVVRNDAVQEMGRYPNSDADHGGFLYLESHNGTSSITDDDLPSSPNWKGAELVVRAWKQLLDRAPITSHSGGTLTAALDAEPHDGFGYFIQNDIRTLDKDGEWFYNKATHKLSMVFAAQPPAQFSVRAATIDTLVFASDKNYVTLTGLSFSGSNTAAVLLRYCTNITLSGCDFLFNGDDALALNGTSKLQVLDNNFDHTLSNAIETAIAGDNWTIRGNTILHTALFPGLCQRGALTGYGIYARGNSQTIEQNYIDQVGYTGVRFVGSNILVKNNYIANFTLIKDDGGGIYVWNTDGSNRKITGNIIVHGVSEGWGIGSSTGKGGSCSGIYLDDRAANIEITGNTVSDCSRSGILLLNAYNIKVNDNTLYNNPKQMMMVWRGDAPMHDIEMKRNVFFSAQPIQDVVNVQVAASDINKIGKVDSNYYCRPADENMIIKASWLNALGSTLNGAYDLPAWQDGYIHDAHTQRTARQLPSYVVNSLIGSNKMGNGKFEGDATGILSSGGTVSWLSSKLDGGTCQVSLPGGYSQTTIPVGAVSSGKKYILRFSVQASKDTVLSMFLRQRVGERQKLSLARNLTIETRRKEYEFLFDAPSSDPDAAVTLVTGAGNTKMWFDNVQFYEADVSLQDPLQMIRFEYNASASPRTVLLDYPYVDVKGKAYTGSLTLQPYTSIILLGSNPAYIGANKMPTVSITTPTNSSSYSAPATFNITAKATDGDGKVAKVEFFRDSTLIGTASGSPYSISWKNVAAGTYAVTARATDDDGMTATSDPITVSVKDSKAPTVSITSPVANASFSIPTSITLTAQAADSDGSISKVEFYAGSTLLGTATTAPYTVAWNNATTGIYSLTAKATDNNGLTTTSAAVVGIVVSLPSPSPSGGSVNSEIISYGSGWKYLDNGSDQGTAWRNPSFDDGTWKSGEGELGYGDGDETTVVDYGSNASKKYITTYFRKTFTIADTSWFSGYTLNLKRDDGAVVYLNGVEVFRSNMPNGSIGYMTLASSTSDGGTVEQVKALTIDQLRQGTNVIAVEIHQNKANSSDISFDLELVGVPKNSANNTRTTNARTLTSVSEQQMAATPLIVKPYPNPSSSYFTLSVQGSGTEPISVNVYDMSGRLMESRAGLAANTTIQFGSKLQTGVYIVQLVQGKQRTETKISKL